MHFFYQLMTVIQKCTFHTHSFVWIVEAMRDLKIGNTKKSKKGVTFE